MKLLISAIFLFICAAAFGANPAYDAFRGAGGITVTSNPPNGTIIIDGSGVVASGTNSSIRASTNGTAVSAGATNINFTAGTNLVLSGTNIGSTAHINYRLADSVSLGGSLLVNSNSTFGGNAQFDSPAVFSDEATFNGPITMPAGAAAGRVITSDALGTFSWTDPTGGGSAGTNIAIGQTLYLDAAFGNDATAGRTNLLRPYQTSSNATSAILSGDTLWVRGGTYLVNPKTNFAEFPNLNSSGGVTISNKNNFRITGEPGAVWAMSSRISIGGTSSAPMMVIAGCTNFVIEGMTFVGIRTTNYASQDFAIMMDRCANWTIRNCTFSNWNNQGITDGGLADGLNLNVNQNFVIRDCQFYNIGNTNVANLGSDGSAISINASNFVVDNNLFVNCYREYECYRNGDVRNWRFSNNRSFGNYGQVLVLEATNNLSDGLVFNNRAYGYSTTLPFGVTEAVFASTHGMSNVLFSQNFVNGMSGIIWGTAGMGGPFPMRDVSIIGNEFEDALYRAILIRQDPSHSGRVERLIIRGNKIRNNFYEAMSVTGNNTVIADNELVDCGTVLAAQGAMAVGSFVSSFATNSTNIIITGNKIFSSNRGQYAGATGIVIYPQCVGTVVVGNHIDTNTYIGKIHDLGVGTRTRPVNLVAVGSLLRSDAAGDERAVTIGSGIGWDGTNLTASGGSGSPGGTNLSIQFNQGGSFAGTNEFIYRRSDNTFILTNKADSVAVNLSVTTLYAHGDSDFYFGVGGSPKWRMEGSTGHLLPQTSNSVSVGSVPYPVKTNYMVGFFMAQDARKNKQLRSVDSGGVGVWSPTASGGNGNTEGANEAARGAIQFAETNATGGYMMNNSTNEFVYTNRTLVVPIISVQTQYIATLVVTNGLPAAGSTFDVQYNASGVLGASVNFRHLPSGYQTQFKHPTVPGEIDINGEGFITQSVGGSAALAFGIGTHTNLMIEPTGGLIVRPFTGLATNRFQIENTNNVPSVTVNSNGSLSIGADTGAVGVIAFRAGNGTNFQFEGAPTMPTNVTYRLPKTSTPGIVVAEYVGGNTNQMTNVTLSAGQYLTYDGTAYVASNLPASSGGSTQMVTAAIGDLRVTNRLDVLYPATAGFRLWIGSNTQATATMVVTNGCVAIGPAIEGAMDGTHRLRVQGSIYSSSGLTVGNAVYGSTTAKLATTGALFYDSSSYMYDTTDGVISFVKNNQRDFTGIVLGTNSTAAQAGWAASMPMLKKARTSGSGAGFKITDQSDSTNGAFLEIKALMPGTTNIAPSADSIVIFAVTNSSGIAQSWVMQEDGAMSQFSPHADDAPPEFYCVTNWMRGVAPTIRVTRHMRSGMIEWNNDSLRSMMFEWMMSGTNMSTISLHGAVHRIETFEEYNLRTGAKLSTNGF